MYISTTKCSALFDFFSIIVDITFLKSTSLIDLQNKLFSSLVQNSFGLVYEKSLSLFYIMPVEEFSYILNSKY